MIDKLIGWSLRYRVLVITLAAAFLGWGAYVLRDMPLDVLPDLSAPTVTILVEGGHIADSGTHEDLLTRLGTYRKLYELQFMELDPKMVDEPGIVVREPQSKN